MNEDPTVLLAGPGAELLALVAERFPGVAPDLAAATRLRRDYPADLVAAALAQHELRLAARAKFSRAAEMLFTRAGYEQSSSEMIARHRAARLARAERVADLCCGIGGDLAALAASGPGRQLLAVDLNPVHARLARHNAAVYASPGPGAAGAGGGGADVRASVGDVRACAADVRDIRLAGFDAVFIDPARREGGRRFRTGQSEPPLEWCFALAGEVLAGHAPAGGVLAGGVRAGGVLAGGVRAGGVRAGGVRMRGGLAGGGLAVCVKAAPGLDTGVIPAGWEAEFIADGRDLKEAALWSPALAGNSRRATVLPGGHSLLPVPGEPVPLGPPGEYLLDPNPAVTRAGLVEDLARQVGGSKIDPRIAFLSVEEEVTTPFARTLRVVDSAPWNEKRFAARLRELNVGSADLRRRGLAGDVEAIRRRLKLRGPHRATIVLTRVSDQPWGLICADLGSPLAC